MGYFAAAQGMKRKVALVLHHLGLMVADNTIRNAMSIIGDACIARLRTAVSQERKPFSLIFDNLVRTQKVQEQNLHNKQTLDKLTAGALHFLNIPNYNPDNSLKPGLGFDSCFKRPAVWRVPYEAIVRDETLESYYPRICKAYILQVLQKYVGVGKLKEAAEYLRQGNHSYRHVEKLASASFPEYHKVPRGRSQLHPLRTMDIDPGTAEGNGEVLDFILENQLNISWHDLPGRMIPVHGDLYTVKCIQSAKLRRRRDLPHNQWSYAQPITGLFHQQWALLQTIYSAHLGRPDSRDPGSLNHLMTILGRAGISENVKTFDNGDAFLRTVYDAHVLMMLIEWAETLRKWQFNYDATSEICTLDQLCT